MKVIPTKAQILNYRLADMRATRLSKQSEPVSPEVYQPERISEACLNHYRMALTAKTAEWVGECDWNKITHLIDDVLQDSYRDACEYRYRDDDGALWAAHRPRVELSEKDHSPVINVYIGTKLMAEFS